MAINYPGPWEIRINYTTTINSVTRQHQMRHSFISNLEGNVGDLFDEWTPIQRNGNSVANLDTLTNAWLTKVREAYTAAASFSSVELWKYEDLSFNAQWYAEKPVGEVGTNSGTIQLASEAIFSFRTTNGGAMRVTILESLQAAGLTQQLPLTASYMDDLADHVLADTNWFIGRDNGYPIAFLGMHPGQNEAIFKSVYRP